MQLASLMNTQIVLNSIFSFFLPGAGPVLSDLAGSTAGGAQP